MIVSINQPTYLPWLGYFDRIAASDLHIVLDHVQFEKNSFVNRNKVRTKDGWTWLTIPLATKGKFGELPINRIKVADGGRWLRKHWSTLQASYGRSPHFKALRQTFEESYMEAARDDLFMPWVMRQNADIMRYLGISTELMTSSQMQAAGTKSDLVLNLCLEVGASRYLSGPLGRDYLQMDKFGNAGIEVIFHDYVHPVYEQFHPGFEPYMAIVDLLFNQGDMAMNILKSDQGALRDRRASGCS